MEKVWGDAKRDILIHGARAAFNAKIEKHEADWIDGSMRTGKVVLSSHKQTYGSSSRARE